MANVNRMTPAERQAQQEAKAVVLAQPHRRGSDDRRCASALWAACRRLRLRDELYDAGERYAEMSMAYKASIGLGVGNVGNGWGIGLSEEAEAAQAALAKSRYLDAIKVLHRAHPRAFGAVEALCYDQRDCFDDAALKKGLMALALHLGTLKLGINADKPHARA